jgi:hypothetical protein
LDGDLLDSVMSAVTMAGTMIAAEKTAFFLNTMTDNLTTAVVAFRCQRFDRAFKRIKRVSVITDRYRERFLVIISTDFALAHHAPRAGKAYDMGTTTSKANEIPNQAS